MGRTVAPIHNYSVYIHYDCNKVPFYVGVGKGYEWRRYTSRPKVWYSRVIKNRFMSDVLYHDLDKETAIRIRNAVVWYHYNVLKVKPFAFINDEVIPNSEPKIEYGEANVFKFITKNFKRHFTFCKCLMWINMDVRNYHPKYLSGHSKY